MRTILSVSGKSERFQFIFFLGLIFSTLWAFGQTEDERQKRLMEEQRNQMLKIEELVKKYPKTWRDTVEAIRAKERFAQGQRQVEMYRNHARIDTLREIDLSYAQLDEIPDFVFRADSLRMLILDWNKIRKLPKELAGLDSLKKIYWRNNDFKGKKPKITKLPQVTKLAMDGGKLEKVPSFKRLAGLEVLELKKNLIEEIPINQISKNKKLKELAIGENPLKLSEARYGKIDFLKVLKVNKSELTGFHPSMYQLTHLDEWQLQENKLKTLPEGISAMKNLTKFSCYKNELESLPKDFWDLERLKVVDLYYNQLEVIPAEINHLDSLEILYLSNNKVYNVPKELGDLTQLEELYLHTNRISVLPEALSNLDKLRVIRVNDNYLTEFPVSILGMEAIREVDVNNNDLTTLPAEVEQLSKLTLFSFQNNDIDLQTEGHIPYMIDRMIKRGVICLPSITQQEVEVGGGE